MNTIMCVWHGWKAVENCRSAIPDDFYVQTFQIAGNVYYIGNKAVCSHLIDTGEG